MMTASNVVEAEETLTGRCTQEMRAGRHVLTADEPLSGGGDDAGPGPYECLLMRLGALDGHFAVTQSRTRIFPNMMASITVS